MGEGHTWSCSCGENFPEYYGSDGILTHMRTTGGKKKGHTIQGLVQENGTVLAKSINEAVREGYVQPGLDDKGGIGTSTSTPSPDTKKSLGIKARVVSPVFDLDPRLVLLYDNTRTRFPDYTKTFSEWITECVIEFHKEHAKTLGVWDFFYEEKETGQSQEQEYEEEEVPANVN